MIFRNRGEPYGNYPQYGNHAVFSPPPISEEEDRRRRQHQEEESERARQAEQAKFAEELRHNFRQREDERQAAEQAREATQKAREKERERDRARRAAKALAKAEEQQQAVAEAEALQAPRAPTLPTPPAELSPVETVIEPTTTTTMHGEGNNHMATATTTKTDAAETKTSAALDWTKRAFSAGAEGAKDGAALVAAETLTAGVIAAISVEAPIVLTIYNNSALAQKLLQVLVPYSLGLAATMGWLPQSEMVAQLAERALRAAISGNIGPLFARFKLPIMRVVESAMRDTADADRFASLGRSNAS